MRDADLVQSRLSPLWERDRHDLRHEQAVALLVWSTTGLIDDGGFRALVEALGEQADHAADAFREVALPRRAAVVSDALALFPRRASRPDRAPLVAAAPQTRGRRASRQGGFVLLRARRGGSGGQGRCGLREVAP